MSDANRYLATGTLVVASIFYFVALPYADSFAGGLAVSAFGAAMVGGMADWFAVSALFRKPLGIPWRTAVIPRNRQRLFAMIVDMVQEELLAKEDIKRKIAEYDIVGVLLNYLEAGGSRTLKRILHKLIADILEKVEPQAVARFLARFIRENTELIQLSPLLRGVDSWLQQSGADRKVSGFIAAELAGIVRTDDFRDLLTAFMRAALSSYESDKSRRKLFNQAAGVSPAALAVLAQDKLLAWLEQLRQPDHPLPGILRQRFHTYLQRLEQAQSRDAANESARQLAGGVDPAGITLRAVEALLRQLAAEQQPALQLLRYVDRLLDKLLAGFQADPLQRLKVNTLIKQALSAFLDEHHHRIGGLVRERLERFSDAELTAFIESKVGKDLQFIRINGSLIGGLTGSILYCLTFWL
ncbi:MAG: DUF445 domain-containing protein [Sporomusaceae bacterium]|nr:DUF445 domain-containing protein [Sporomusaceae bacterium]